jgi:LysR family transcriptional regulator for bpeEF and oprC
LLQRTTRRLTLTADGVACLERASVLLREFAEMESQISGAVVRPSGRLRVDVPAAFGRHVLMPALPEFFALYPDIVLEVGSTDRPVDLVREGVDCVVRGGNVFDESLVARKLGEFSVITCAAPSYLACSGTPTSIGDLAQHQFVNFFSARTGSIFPFDFTRGTQVHAIHRPHQVAANDADSYLEAGLAGMGLMQVPATAYVREHIAQGRLVPVLPDWGGGTLPMHVLYPRNRHLSARVRVFSDWMHAIFARELG